VPTKGGKALDALASDPAALFRSLSDKLGGKTKLASYLGCSRNTAYNLASGRKRWSANYLQKALTLLGDHPVVNVNAKMRGQFEIPNQDWCFIKPKALVLDYDGAFLVQGHSMWPLVGDGQYVLYRDVTPEELETGDIVLIRMRTGETLIKAWYPSHKKKNAVFLASIYRGPQEFRQDLFMPVPIKDMNELRKVVGVWLG